MHKLNQKGFGAVEILFITFIIGSIIGITWYIQTQNKKEENSSTAITNFDECVAAGNPVMESFPEKCSADGQTFTNISSNKPEKTTLNVNYIKQSDVDPKLVAVFKKTYSAAAPECQFTDSKKDTYVDLDKSIRRYKANLMATADIGCKGIKIHLFGYQNGSWLDIGNSQMELACKDLRTYQVPVAWLKEMSDPYNANSNQTTAKCFDGTKDVEYKGFN